MSDDTRAHMILALDLAERTHRDVGQEATADLLAEAGAMLRVDARLIGKLEDAIRRDTEVMKLLAEERQRSFELLAEIGSLKEWRKVPGNRTLEIQYHVAEVAIMHGGLDVVDYTLKQMRDEIRAALAKKKEEASHG